LVHGRGDAVLLEEIHGLNGAVDGLP